MSFEFPIIIYSDIARTEELKRRGAPIEWVRAEPHITVLVSAAITREARHPAAARLFMNYLAADEGQKEVVAMDKPPALPNFSRSICAESNSIQRTGRCRILMKNTTNFTVKSFGQASKSAL